MLSTARMSNSVNVGQNRLPTAARDHTNLNLRREVGKSRLGLMVPSRTPRPKRFLSEDVERVAEVEMALDVQN